MKVTENKNVLFEPKHYNILFSHYLCSVPIVTFYNIKWRKQNFKNSIIIWK